MCEPRKAEEGRKKKRVGRGGEERWGGGRRVGGDGCVKGRKGF